ncbi:MAG: FAD-dependent oxidoreductase [Pseudomonadota bacterium]
MALLDTWRGAPYRGQAKAVMSWSGLTIFDESIDVLDMLRAYAERASQESCGQCVPCRSGLHLIAERLQGMCKGISQPDDTTYLSTMARTIMMSARCDIGKTTTRALLDVIEQAPHCMVAHETNQGDYTSLVTAPCISACPAHVNIPDYIEKIRLRQFNEGFDCVMDRCPMPSTIGRVCEHPCEAVCTRGHNGAPIAIRHLKRFLADNKALKEEKISAFPAIDSQENSHKHRNSQHKVAIIGAGPAGLSCAYYLLLQGVSVTIFEKEVCGGGMAKYGIPDYRLPVDVLAHEVERVQKLGGTIHYGVNVGKDCTIADLRDQGFGAIFIGSGAPNAPNMPIEGDKVNGGVIKNYVSGIEYLHDAAQGKQSVHGTSLAVVGGGNVAMDCVRTALRQGFQDVHILYRRTEAEMPADPMEIHEAKLEGVTFNFLVAPEKLLSEHGQVTGIVCQKMRLGAPDASGRRRPEAIEGEKFTLHCDVVMHAIGQKVAVDEVLAGLDHEVPMSDMVTDWKTLKAQTLTGQVSSIPYLFGGGDCVTGPRTLIAALAAGKRTANHIAQYLQALNADAILEASELEIMEDALMPSPMLMPVIADNELTLPYENATRMPVHALELDKRLQDFSEVENGSTDAEAVTEAERCLRCYRILMIAR